MLPPHLRAIASYISKAIDEAQRGADNRQKRTTEVQQEVVAAIKAMADDFKSSQAKRESAERKKGTKENWTIGTLVGTVSATVALAIIGGLQWCTLKSTEDVLTATLESKRPWIGFTEDSFRVINPFGKADDGAYLTVSIDKVKNGGDTAARGVNVTFSKLIVGPLPTNPNEINTVYPSPNPCEQDAVMKKFAVGELVLPGQEIPLGPVDFFAPKSELKGDGKEVWITGCIGYMDAVRKPHATTFTYSVNGLMIQRIPGISSQGNRMWI